jgi:hypothetical protein
LEWRYSKLAPLSAGEDRGWLDQVQYTPAINSGCPVALSPTNQLYGSLSWTGIITVVADASCYWEVFNTNAWISIVPPTSGIGNASVQYVVAANPTALARSGNINIGGRKVAITQTPGPGNCAISISPRTRTHGYGSVSASVAVATQDGCPWSVINSNSWITILSGLNNSGLGIVTYSLASNPNTYARGGTIIIGGQHFVLTQAGISLSQTNAPRLQFMGRMEPGATVFLQGAEGKMYVLECSEDLVHWTPISTNSAPSTVIDTAAGNAAQRFYRTVEIP